MFIQPSFRQIIAYEQQQNVSIFFIIVLLLPTKTCFET